VLISSDAQHRSTVPAESCGPPPGASPALRNLGRTDSHSPRQGYQFFSWPTRTAPTCSSCRAATYTIKAHGTSASGRSGWEEATGVIIADGCDLTAGITVGASAAQELASSRTCSRS
jgi:hypothetical protein